MQNQYFVWEGRRHTVTLSAGVAAFGAAPSLPFGAALGLADAACFLAKEKGRNRVQVAELTDEEVRQQQHDMDSVGRLKDAIGEDRIVFYVQKIDSLGSHGSWPEFRERFKRELSQRGAQLDQLRGLASKGPATLVYAARDELHNDAVVLRDVLLPRH